MFVYGTNEFLKQRCWKINQCECWCMPSASKDGVCDVTSQKGYRLFKLASKGRCFIALNVTGSLSEANLIWIIYLQKNSLNSRWNFLSLRIQRDVCQRQKNLWLKEYKIMEW